MLAAEPTDVLATEAGLEVTVPVAVTIPLPVDTEMPVELPEVIVLTPVSKSARLRSKKRHTRLSWHNSAPWA